MIERDIPGAAGLSREQCEALAQRSMCALEHIPGYRWIHSYVAGDKFYCVHEAPHEEAVREHSRRGGFPIASITEISAVLDPKTAPGKAAAAVS